MPTGVVDTADVLRWGSAAHRSFWRLASRGMSWLSSSPRAPARVRGARREPACDARARRVGPRGRAHRWPVVRHPRRRPRERRARAPASLGFGYRAFVEKIDPETIVAEIVAGVPVP